MARIVLDPQVRLVEDWLDTTNYARRTKLTKRSTVRCWLAWCQTHRRNPMNPADLTRWANWMQDRSYNPLTITQRFLTLADWYTFLADTRPSARQTLRAAAATARIIGVDSRPTAKRLDPR